jgi:hypothetical protein
MKYIYMVRALWGLVTEHMKKRMKVTQIRPEHADLVDERRSYKKGII